MDPTALQLTPISRSRPIYRYAPSPTGDLHLGNLRTAILAHEACRREGGIFILRIEDIDAPRTVPGSESRLIEDLRWLGLDWDEGPDVGGPAGPYRQSERGAIYKTALARLDELGLTYPCTCSRKDLREASAPHGTDDSPYPGTCRGRDREVQQKHPAGAAIRFRTDVFRSIEFEDLLQGAQRFDLGALTGDFIVRRRDGLWAYQLACAVDDVLMGVTHVIRGRDLLESTPRQIAILRALGLPEPRYGHVPLVVTDEGERMSKRDGSLSLRTLMASGVNPQEARKIIMHQPIGEPGNSKFPGI